ncbi:PMS2-C terminal-like protein [Zopfochytrium polystomum]|nr:PMS2-C terminal-like protein [Zopfochytrium polystomum]
MQILGQFNLGFIIVRLGDDLFMVDQHASDEKFNYESLRAALKFSTQRLICPMNLEVPAQSELVMMDNMDIIRKNGFELEVNESAPPGRRLILVAIPQHKSVSFNAADLEDLVHRISESSSDENVRCAKALSMLASQACRKSVMIGDPLDLSQMAKIVRHMAELDQPWNCPHGRPTMRHLLDLRKLAEDVELA